MHHVGVRAAQQVFKRGGDRLAVLQDLSRLGEVDHGQQVVHGPFLSHGAEEVEGFAFHARSDDVGTVLGVSTLEVKEPRQCEGEAGDVAVLAGGVDGLLHGQDGFAVTAKVGLQDGQVEEGVLVEGAVALVHRIIEIAMQTVEGGQIVAGPPRIEEEEIVAQVGDGHLGVHHVA